MNLISPAHDTKNRDGMCNRAPQLKINIHGSGDGRKASQNYPLRLGPGSFGSKLMDLDGLKVSNFQPNNKA